MRELTAVRSNALLHLTLQSGKEWSVPYSSVKSITPYPDGSVLHVGSGFYEVLNRLAEDVKTEYAVRTGGTLKYLTYPSIHRLVGV